MTEKEELQQELSGLIAAKEMLDSTLRHGGLFSTNAKALRYENLGWEIDVSRKSPEEWIGHLYGPTLDYVVQGEVGPAVLHRLLACLWERQGVLQTKILNAV